MPLPPTRCHSCGRVVADKYLAYLEAVKKNGGNPVPDVMYYGTNDTTKSAHGLALDELGIKNNCCRMIMLSQPRD